LGHGFSALRLLDHPRSDNLINGRLQSAQNRIAGQIQNLLEATPHYEVNVRFRWNTNRTRRRKPGLGLDSSRFSGCCDVQCFEGITWGKAPSVHFGTKPAKEFRCPSCGKTLVYKRQIRKTMERPIYPDETNAFDNASKFPTWEH
jgi:hypothetical protein